MVPFLIWPDSRDEAQCRQAIVNGPLTEAKKEAVEALAWEFLEERGAACDTLIWRLKPEWESERSFEHQTQRHILRMQAGFYNDTWP